MKKFVTAEEYDNAVRRTISILVEDPRLDEMAAFLVPATGVLFARVLREVLFMEEEEEE